MIMCRDARKAKGLVRRRRKDDGLVKGEASHRSGRQTEYRRKAGRRNNVDMGEGGSRLDGNKRESSLPVESDLALTGQSAITKEDRDARKAEIDTETARLISLGMAKTLAKTRATEKWDVENPWFKAGSTRGKVAKSKTAAELRAEAAERRLQASVKREGELERMDGGGSDTDSDGEDQNVPDPHIGYEERRREMEAEMDEDEKAGLRDEWREFMDAMGWQGARGAIRGVKREHSPDVAAPARVPKPPPEVKREPPHRSDPVPPAVALSSDRRVPPLEQKPEIHSLESTVQSNGAPGWTCPRCTYTNLLDHGRCGTWQLVASLACPADNASEICQGRPDGSIPDDVSG